MVPKSSSTSPSFTERSRGLGMRASLSAHIDTGPHALPHCRRTSGCLPLRGGNREAGSRPARSRHCSRRARLFQAQERATTRGDRGRLEARRRAGSQETCPDRQPSRLPRVKELQDVGPALPGLPASPHSGRVGPPQGGIVQTQILAVSLTLWFTPSRVPAAAAAEPGALSGSVRTSEGRPVPALALALTGPSGTRTLITGPEGRYQVTGLSPGEYILTVSAPGFVLSPAPRVRVDSGPARLDL